MESHLWRQMNSRDHHRHQVDLTLRLGFPNGDGGEPLPADIDRNQPFFTTDHLHDINHHAFQTHQVMVNNHGGINGEMMMMSEAIYNPQQIVWSQELQTYVLSSNYNYGQQHQVNNNNAIGSSNANNLDNLPVLQKNKNDLYTLLNPAASRIADDHEAEASSSGRRKGSRRRRVASCNDPEKRCTNYNCNTNFTPMWRKGPLGPKSLCNACGIRYRKELLNQTAENSHS